MPDDVRTVHVVDDEVAVRRSLTLLLAADGYSVRTYEDGEAFLDAARPHPAFGCVLLDMRLPGMDGLAVHGAMVRRRMMHPVVLITGHGDVPIAVRAIKAGICDFIEKPFTGADILRAVAAALEHGSAAEAEAREAAVAQARIATLSARETEVLQALMAGRQNKVIALGLGISPRTVEIHRGNLMSKLGVRSLPEAVRLALAAGMKPPA